MKLRSWMMLGVGYVLGSKAGQEGYQELRQRVSELASSPQVADALAKARENLGLAPSMPALERASRTAGDGDETSGATGEVDVTDSEEDRSPRPQDAESLP